MVSNGGIVDIIIAIVFICIGVIGILSLCIGASSGAEISNRRTRNVNIVTTTTTKPPVIASVTTTALSPNSLIGYSPYPAGNEVPLSLAAPPPYPDPDEKPPPGQVELSTTLEVLLQYAHLPLDSLQEWVQFGWMIFNVLHLTLCYQHVHIVDLGMRTVFTRRMWL